jgi:hypothetical protein
MEKEKRYFFRQRSVNCFRQIFGSLRLVVGQFEAEGDESCYSPPQARRDAEDSQRKIQLSLRYLGVALRLGGEHQATSHAIPD